MKIYFFQIQFLLLYFFSSILICQQFTELTSVSLLPIENGSVAWGDYDNDGDLDILLTGLFSSYPSFSPVSKIYHNDGNNSFTEQTSILLTGVMQSSVAWGDYDNDGDLDILLTGNSFYSPSVEPVSKIYRNNGDNTFTEQTSILLAGVSSSSVAWGDYDNDGDLDILLTGISESNLNLIPVSKIYRNNGNNTFTEQTSILLTGVMQSSVAWGDYDNDGDLDILLTGYTGSGQVSKIYRNNGNNTFTEQTSILLAGVSSSSVAWGDYDNDGDLDILLTGFSIVAPISRIFRNNGDNTFTDVASLTGVGSSSVAWGDYDNDGDLDILLTGRHWETERVSIIYRNDGSDIFTEQTSISLIDVWGSSVAWGDYDNDGDLDILLTGNTKYLQFEYRVSKIYRNNNITANTLPTIPANLSSSTDSNEVTLNWDKSTDNETPQNGLKYNLVIGTIPGGSNIISPMSDLTNGYRRKIDLGNTNHRNNWTIEDLEPGTYYWSVQALDNCFAGSKFSDQETFTISLSNLNDKFRDGIPSEFKLYQNFPNPFNPSTIINYQLPIGGNVTLKVFDILGNEVATLAEEYKPAGKYETEYNASLPPSGVYFYQLIAGDFVQTKKMILIK